MRLLQVELKKLIDLQCRGATVFDLHEEFGLAYLVEHDKTMTLYLNDLRCRSWSRVIIPSFTRSDGSASIKSSPGWSIFVRL